MPLSYFDFISPATDVLGTTDMGPDGSNLSDGAVRMNRIQFALANLKAVLGTQPEGVEGYLTVQDRVTAHSRSLILVAPKSSDQAWREASDFVLPGTVAGGNAAKLGQALTAASALGGSSVLIGPGGEAPDFATAITVPANCELVIGWGQTCHFRAGIVLSDGAHLRLEKGALVFGYGNVPVIDMQGSGCSVIGALADRAGASRNSVRRNDANNAAVVKCYGTGTGVGHRIGNVLKQVSLFNNGRSAPIVDLKQVSYLTAGELALAGGTVGGIVCDGVDNSVFDFVQYGDVSSRAATFPTATKGCVHITGVTEGCFNLSFTRQRFKDFHDNAIYIDSPSLNCTNIRFNDYTVSDDTFVRTAPMVYARGVVGLSLRDGNVTMGDWFGGAGAAQDAAYVTGSFSVDIDGMAIGVSGTHRTWKAGVRIDSCNGVRLDGVWGSASAVNFPVEALVVYQGQNSNVAEGAVAFTVDLSGSAVDRIGSPLTHATIQQSGVRQTTVPTTLAINTSLFDVYDLTLTGSAGTRALTFTGWPAASDEATVKVYVRNDGTGGKTPLWPATVLWPSGVIPTATSSPGGVDVYVFFSPDGGTTVFGVLVDAAFR